MKKINPILPIIILIFTLSSCGYRLGTGNKMNNLSHWKQDREEKKEVTKSVKNTLTKN